MQTAAILVLVGLVGLAAAVDIQVRLSGLKGLSYRRCRWATGGGNTQLSVKS
jgi:hypothetical protein